MMQVHDSGVVVDRSPTKQFPWIGCLLTAGVLLGIAVLGAALGLVILRNREASGVQARQRAILYEVNSDELYAACMFVFAHKAEFGRDPSWHNMDPGDLSKPDPDDPRIPPIIKRLKPSYIDVGVDGVRLEMGGGPYHYGVDAFLPGKTGGGTERLRADLWYYAEDGAVPAKAPRDR